MGASPLDTPMRPVVPSELAVTDGDEPASVRRLAGSSGRGGPPTEMEGPLIDLARAERAVVDLLDALGVDRGSEVIATTPARVCRAYAELLTPMPFEATTFPNGEGYDELVVASNVPFCSLCEHHLLPFSGGLTSATFPAPAWLGCPNWPAWSSTSLGGCSARSDSRCKWPTGSVPSWHPGASV